MEYRDNSSWQQNGIIRNGIAVDYPWTCNLCAHRPVFMTLGECGPHCATKAHKKALYWRFEYSGDKAPDAPQWSPTPAEGAVCGPNFGGPPPRSAQPGSLPSAADLRDHSSTAPAGICKYKVILHGATLNGEFISAATLEVEIPCVGGSPPRMTYEMYDVNITGQVRPGHSSIAHGSSLLSPRSQLRAGASVVADPSSSGLPVAQSGPSSATTHGAVPGMAVLLVAPTLIEVAPAAAQWQSAAPARASFWLGQGRRVNEGDGDSSEPAESPGR